MKTENWKLRQGTWKMNKEDFQNKITNILTEIEGSDRGIPNLIITDILEIDGTENERKWRDLSRVQIFVSAPDKFKDDVISCICMNKAKWISASHSSWESFVEIQAPKILHEGKNLHHMDNYRSIHIWRLFKMSKKQLLREKFESLWEVITIIPYSGRIYFEKNIDCLTSEFDRLLAIHHDKIIFDTCGRFHYSFLNVSFGLNR